MCKAVEVPRVREPDANSHAQGQGSAIGADGLMVEAHPAPEKAMSDGAQSLELGQFARMMEELKPYIELWKSARSKDLASVPAR